MKKNFSWKIIGKKILYAKEVGEKISPNLFIFQYEGKYGIIDSSFSWIIPATFDYLLIANRKLLWAKSKNYWSLIDHEGNTLSNDHYKDISTFVKGIACVSLDHNRYGFINTKGKLVLPYQYRKGVHLGNNLFLLHQTVHQSITEKTTINLKGEIIKYGIINAKQEIIYPFIMNKKPTREKILSIIKALYNLNNSNSLLIFL